MGRVLSQHFLIFSYPKPGPHVTQDGGPGDREHAPPPPPRPTQPCRQAAQPAFSEAHTGGRPQAQASASGPKAWKWSVWACRKWLSLRKGHKELVLAKGYWERGTSLGWGQFSRVSKWAICGTLNDMNKSWVSGGGAAWTEGAPEGQGAGEKPGQSHGGRGHPD